MDASQCNIQDAGARAFAAALETNTAVIELLVLSLAGSVQRPLSASAAAD
jgi:hypothetical protein